MSGEGPPTPEQVTAGIPERTRAGRAARRGLYRAVVHFEFFADSPDDATTTMLQIFDGGLGSAPTASYAIRSVRRVMRTVPA